VGPLRAGRRGSRFGDGRPAEAFGALGGVEGLTGFFFLAVHLQRRAATFQADRRVFFWSIRPRPISVFFFSSFFSFSLFVWGKRALSGCSGSVVSLHSRARGGLLRICRDGGQAKGRKEKPVNLDPRPWPSSPGGGCPPPRKPGPAVNGFSFFLAVFGFAFSFGASDHGRTFFPSPAVGRNRTRPQGPLQPTWFCGRTTPGFGGGQRFFAAGIPSRGGPMLKFQVCSQPRPGSEGQLTPCKGRHFHDGGFAGLGNWKPFGRGFPGRGWEFSPPHLAKPFCPAGDRFGRKKVVFLPPDDGIGITIFLFPPRLWAARRQTNYSQWKPFRTKDIRFAAKRSQGKFRFDPQPGHGAFLTRLPLQLRVKRLQ